MNFGHEMLILLWTICEPDLSSVRTDRLSGIGSMDFEPEKTLPLLPVLFLDNSDGCRLCQAVKLSVFGFLDFECKQFLLYWCLRIVGGFVCIVGGFVCIIGGFECILLGLGFDRDVAIVNDGDGLMTSRFASVGKPR